MTLITTMPTGECSTKPWLALDRFSDGVKSLLRGAKRHSIALMCAERRSEDCHRSLLIARHLWESHGIQVAHILPDGGIEAHSDMCKRLAGESSTVSDALRRQAQHVGYQKRELSGWGSRPRIFSE